MRVERCRLIADAADVEDHEVLAIGVDDAFKLPIVTLSRCGASGDGIEVAYYEQPAHSRIVD